MRDENEPERKPVAFMLGQDVSLFSLGDLDQTIEALKSEIVRLADARAKKLASQAAAESLFR